jgi:hypothetical protein
MRHTIKLFVAEGWWHSKHSDPEIVALFGTDTLPTPWSAAEPASHVLDAIERLNPASDVAIEGGRA